MNFEKSFLKNSNFESFKKEEEEKREEKKFDLSEEKIEKVDNREIEINPLLKSNLEKLNPDVREFIESDKETLKTISKFIDCFEKYGLQSEKIKKYLNMNLKHFLGKEALSDEDFKKGFYEFFNYCFDKAIENIQPLVDKLQEKKDDKLISTLISEFQGFFIYIGRMSFDSFMDEMLRKGIIDKSNYDSIYSVEKNIYIHPLSGSPLLGNNKFNAILVFNNFQGLRILEQQDFPFSKISVEGYFGGNLKINENIDYLDLYNLRIMDIRFDQNGELLESQTVKNLKQILEQSNIKKIRLNIQQKINYLNKNNQSLDELFNFRNKNGELIKVIL